MKKVYFKVLPIVLLFVAFSTAFAGEKGDKESGVVYLTKDTFKELVFDYELNKTWKYNGKVPAVLDFYADWCCPCKMLAPILEELQAEYGGKIQIYKIDTQKERELAATFGVTSLPTIVFIPLEGEPQGAPGYRGKEELEKIIESVMKVEK